MPGKQAFQIEAPFRVGQISGGTRFVNGRNDATIVIPWQGGILELPDFSRKQMMEAIRATSLKLLSVNVVENSAEYAQRYHLGFELWPIVRPANAQIPAVAPAWKAIANARETEEERAIAERIAYQTSILHCRFESVLNLYHDALCSCIADEHVFEEIRSDVYSVHLAADVHGILNDLYSLTQFVLEQYAYFRFGRRTKSAQKIIEQIDALAETSPLDLYVRSAISKSDAGSTGWVKQAIDYRDLISHTLPFRSLATFAYFIDRTDTSLGSIPSVVFPLFDELEASGNSRELRSMNRMKAIERLHDLRERGNFKDAIEFCHTAYLCLLSIAAQTADHFNLTGRIQEIRDEDIRSTP